MKKFLLALSIGCLLCSCNPLKSDFQQVDYGCKTGVNTDKDIILYGDGVTSDRVYKIDCTRDCLYHFADRPALHSGQPIYIYKCNTGFSASEVNLENARAIYAATTSVDLERKTVVKNSVICLVALIISVLLLVIAFIRDRGGYLMLAIAGVVLVGSISYVGWEGDREITCLKTQSKVTAITPDVVVVGDRYLSADDAVLVDLITQNELAVGDEVTTYCYKDRYFFSSVPFSENDLKCRSCYVCLWQMYALIVLLMLAAGCGVGLCCNTAYRCCTRKKRE